MKKKSQKALSAANEMPGTGEPLIENWADRAPYEATEYFDPATMDPEDFGSTTEPTDKELLLAETLKILYERNRGARDVQLWTDDATRTRPLSEKILGPIKGALRKQGWLQVHSVTGEGPLSDESMEKLFRAGLEPLERALGRLVLDAILDGDRKFAACVDAAVKDSDALFHRGTSEHGTMNEAFFRWKRNVPDAEAVTLTTAEARNRFEKAYRVLNHREWAALRRTFHLDFRQFKQPRRGRPAVVRPK